jgi:hypothetical protein
MAEALTVENDCIMIYDAIIPFKDNYQLELAK